MGRYSMPDCLNWLRVEFHKLHDLNRHAHLNGKAELFRFGGGERIVMCPIGFGPSIFLSGYRFGDPRLEGGL